MNLFLPRQMIYEQKRIHRERGWCRQGLCSFKQQEYVIITEMSSQFPLYDIVHSMSRAGTPTDNAAMKNDLPYPLNCLTPKRYREYYIR